MGDLETLAHESQDLARSATEEETLVGLVHLFQEDEGEDSVGAQSGIVWCEALPQAEETLIADDFQQYIQPILVLWLPINHSHILDPSFDNIHRHGSSSGDQATDHAGAEVAQNVVREVA